LATLYLDEDVSHHIRPLLEATGHTIYTTYQQGRAETSDGDQLLYAAANAWTIISHNRRDFELLHDAWLRWTRAWSLGNRHLGILIISQRISHHDNATVIDTLLSAHPNVDDQLLGYDTTSQVWLLYDITARGYQPFP
jgi:urease accessory protein UreE